MIYEMYIMYYSRTLEIKYKIESTIDKKKLHHSSMMQA